MTLAANAWKDDDLRARALDEVLGPIVRPARTKLQDHCHGVPWPCPISPGLGHPFDNAHAKGANRRI
jgi:hypothetical protein